MQPRNLAARAGRWSATHRKTAIVGWILFVVLATLIGGKVGQQNLESAKMGNGESRQHDLIVDSAGFPDEIGERVLIQGKGSIRADGPEVRAAVTDVVNRLGQIEGVSDIESPLNAGDRANTVSKDGRSVLVTFTLPGKAETKQEQEALESAADAPLAAVAAVQKAHPELHVEEHGGASERKALGATERADEAKSQQISMGGTLIILLLVFGAAVAAGVPLLLGISAFVATTGLLGPVSQLAPLHRGRPDRHDAHRPGRRRRLRDVLHAPDDGRAGQGPLARDRAGHRRRHLGSRGADLRLYRHGRDGRHVLLRQRDLLVLRHRHDHRRRRRDDRVAHVPAGRALLPRPEGLAGEGPRALHRQASSQQQGRVARSGTRS